MDKKSRDKPKKRAYHIMRAFFLLVVIICVIAVLYILLIGLINYFSPHMNTTEYISTLPRGFIVANNTYYWVLFASNTSTHRSLLLSNASN